jgi:hypothetical protein
MVGRAVTPAASNVYHGKATTRGDDPAVGGHDPRGSAECDTVFTGMTTPGGGL